MKTLSIDTWPAEKLATLAPRLNDFECALFYREWRVLARAGQLSPASDWKTWLIMAGRGFGKTRAGAEWVREQVCAGVRRIGLVAPTNADARDIMVEGESGLLAVCWEGDTTHDGIALGRPVHETSRRRVVWKNGAVAMMFSAEEPERLRGPQHEKIWCDELAAWRYLRRTWDMAMFGLRLGSNPQACITTTPRPLKLLREIATDAATALTRGTTFDNAIHLAPGFVETVRRRYQGTRLGRQELDGEIIDQRENALWTRSMLEAAIAPPECEMRRIVVAVDPPATARKSSNACGIIVAGLGADGRCYILADETLACAKPHDWASRAVKIFRRFNADRVVVEVNQGGDMVEAVIRTIDPHLPIRSVRATRGKWLRAEPVAALYEQGRIRHAGRFARLEDEMCEFDADGGAAGRSPDRVDALVWAVTDLMLGVDNYPRIRPWS